MMNSKGIGFWGDRENVDVLKSIWERTPEEVAANSKPKRCFVKGPNVERYPTSVDFDLRELMAKYASKMPCRTPAENGAAGAAAPRFCLVRGSKPSMEVPKDFGLTEVMKNCELEAQDESGKSTPRGGVGCNRDDAVDFAARYGFDSVPKPALYYRLRKGKYRKEF